MTATPSRRAAALIVLVALLVGACAAVGPASSSGPTGPGPSLPGTPGHFDNGDFSFDYPAAWHALSGDYYEGIAVEVSAVLGTGVWHSGCVSTANGGSCTGDTTDVTGGGIVVKVWSIVNGPAPMCMGQTTANATVGPNAVEKTVSGGVTTWQIRRPGQEFGWAANVNVQMWADGTPQEAAAEALVGSFRWGTGDPNAAVKCPGTDTPPPTLRYNGAGVSFDYPASWRLLSGYQHYGLHGPTVMFAVGTGSFDSGCAPTPPSSEVPGGGLTCGSPSAVVTGDEVLVDGSPAIETSGDGWFRWQLNAVGYIQGRWGPDAQDGRTQAASLLASMVLDR